MGDWGKRIGVAGAAFVALQLWEAVRARRSAEKFAQERANPNEGVVSFSDYLAARRAAVQAQPKLLDVRNFSLENLEGVKAPANSAMR